MNYPSNRAPKPRTWPLARFAGHGSTRPRGVAQAPVLALPVVALLCLFVSGAAAEDEQKPSAGTSNADSNRQSISEFSRSDLWDDGLAELSYYDAVDTIYGKPRKYTCVMLLNREWLLPYQRVKAERPDPAAGHIPVLKLNVAEQIPTENYNYRRLTTLFLNRESMLPEKLAATSQEWCGSTFRQFQWNSGQVRIRGFGYFEDEGEKEWTVTSEAEGVPIYPEEALFVLARAAVAMQKDLRIHVLPSARSNRLVEPKLRRAALTVAPDSRRVRVPIGSVDGRLVTAQLGDVTWQFDVETAPPHRLLRASTPPGREMSLRFVERRAYWDRNWPSKFYRANAAP